MSAVAMPPPHSHLGGINTPRTHKPCSHLGGNVSALTFHTYSHLDGIDMRGFYYTYSHPGGIQLRVNHTGDFTMAVKQRRWIFRERTSIGRRDFYDTPAAERLSARPAI